MKPPKYPHLQERMIQVVAHLARRLGAVDKTKIMALVYLADRQALASLERPITYDDYKVLKKKK